MESPSPLPEPLVAAEAKRRGFVSGWLTTVRRAVAMIGVFGAVAYGVLWMQSRTIFQVITFSPPKISIIVVFCQGRQEWMVMLDNRASFSGSRLWKFPISHDTLPADPELLRGWMAGSDWGAERMVPPVGPGVAVKSPCWFATGFSLAIALAVWPWKWRARWPRVEP